VATTWSLIISLLIGPLLLRYRLLLSLLLFLILLLLFC
jgi:hypothetical protein